MAHPCGKQREVQGVIAAINANRVLHAYKFGQMLLEIAQLLTQNQITFGKRIGNSEINLIFYPAVMLARIYEWNPV
jgi:hypothetical protein